MAARRPRPYMATISRSDRRGMGTASAQMAYVRDAALHELSVDMLRGCDQVSLDVYSSTARNKRRSHQNR